MAKRGDENNDLSWLYGEDDGLGAPPPPPAPRRSLKISDLYEDEDVVELLPPFEGIDENDGEAARRGRLAALLPFGQREDEFAGADTSDPSSKERERSQRRIRESALITDQDDPFAKLVTPLSNAEVANLRAELAGEEILLVKWRRRHHLHARWRSFSLLLSLAVIALLALRYGHNYVSDNMQNPALPKLLVARLGTDPTKAVMFALAVMLPFLGIAVMIDFFSQTLKLFVLRSLRALALAAISGIALFIGGTFVVEKQTVGALATLAAWAVCRGLIRLVLGRGEDS